MNKYIYGCTIVFLFLCFIPVKAQNKNPFPSVPPAGISAADDLKQMMWQMGFTMPIVPDKQTHYSEVILPKLKAYGSDVTFRPVDAANPSGNWTWATGTTSTWSHEDGTGDKLINIATAGRVADGLWHNYIQAWEPGGDYFTGAKFYKPLALHDLTGLTVADWSKRRAQLLEGIRELYGKIPEAAGKLQIKWSVDSGEIHRSEHPFREYTITGAITNPLGYVAREMPKISGTLRVPLNLPDGRKIPVVIMFGTDEKLWDTMAPANMAVFYFNNQLLQPDQGGQALYSYLTGLVNEGHWRKPEEWGCLVAWSWGVSRLIDFFEQNAGVVPVDTQYIGLTGHSRYGKATLVAMAYDTRIALAFPSSSGALGVSQSRRHWGEEMANVAADPYAYYWVAGNLLKYVGLHPGSTDGYMPRKAMDMPVDAESLIALCAPRPVFLGSGRPEAGEAWVDPYGTYLTARAASPVYELLGKKGLVMNDRMDYHGQSIPMPVINKDYLEGDIGYRNHGEGHVAGPNYPAFLKFIEKYYPKANDIPPRLQKQGTATQLIVDGKPFLILGGELGNSTASTLTELDSIFAKLRQANLNTVLTPAYWELIEPAEGKFDFTSIDTAIEKARAQGLKIVFLWFGAWKNSMSCYAPLWVKMNYKKYPRAVTKAGQPLEIMSAFSQNNLDADRRAFVALMEHIAQVDTDRTVVMMQVENEIGMIVDARDYSQEADQLFHSFVPRQLTDYLTTYKQSLHPQLQARWAANGFRTTGTWTELFGKGLETDELFMTWYYGRFVEEIARAGKAAYPLPMYLNAALNSRGRRPGDYPSAGPLAHLLDVWRAAAPSIDFLAPDIYDPGFTDWCTQYHVKGNPLFIPEIKLTDKNNAAQVFYAFGEHDAMGFSPFSIENAGNHIESPLAKSYHILRQLLPLLADAQGKNRTRGFWFDSVNKECTVRLGNYYLTGKHVYTFGWTPQSLDGSPWMEAGALVLQLSGNEFLVAGTGIAITFTNAIDNGLVTGIGSIDKVSFVDGQMVKQCRMNGDQSHQGRHLRIEAGDWNIQYIKLYDYK